MTARKIGRVIESVPTSDGAGVKLRRSLGKSSGDRVDPFLMLDEFFSDNPGDYLAGFPSHPHRGFETVTYMLDGHMRHEDHLGNRGDLGPGGVQWMTAGRGVIHSEMPQQTQGRMRGFQLWLNLPAKEKLKPAHYRDLAAGEIPVVDLGDGARVKVIAGTLHAGGKAVAGPIQGVSTVPLYLDVHLPPRRWFTHAVPKEHNAFAYVYEGHVLVSDIAPVIEPHNAVVLVDGDQIELVAGDAPARFLLLAAQPLREPVVQYGPFVMNTREEIEQAIADLRAGKLTEELH
jgi:redox-sensitive bicupin YhaK (pirin superfamily)